MYRNQVRSCCYRPQAIINVSGSDAASFLQGQFTNDLRTPTGHVTYGLWLNQKGKVLADSQVLKVSEDDFLLCSPYSTADTIVKRLEQYIVADDVILRDQTSEKRGLVVWGKGSGEVAKLVVGEAPMQGCFVQKNQCLVFPGLRTGGESFEIIGPANEIAILEEKLTAHGVVAAVPAEVEFARISSGIPAIPVDIGPGDLPNEAGLESVAVSYDKGCYLGQEVMARLKAMGQVRRVLWKVHGSSESPKTGVPIYQGGKKVGEIRSAIGSPDGFIALAMVSRSGLDETAGFTLEVPDHSDQRPTVWMS